MAEDGNGESTERYEFDAPSHVVDLQELKSHDIDDKWFDQQSSDETGPAFSPLRPDEQLELTPKPKAVVTSFKNTDMDAVPSTSWATGTSAKRAAQSVVKSAPERQSLRLSKRKREDGNTQPVKKYKKSPVAKPAPKPIVRRSWRQKSDTTNNLNNSEAIRRRNAARSAAALTRPQATKLSHPKHAEGYLGHAANPSTANKKRPERAAYVSVAQSILQFETRTPERFRRSMRQVQGKGPARVKATHMHLTQPRSPNLMTRKRSRPPTVKSGAELEKEAMEELQKVQFKAQELNRKILERTECPKKPAVKAPTTQEAFTLHIEKRLQERQVAKHHDEEEPSTFKARELPKKILDGVVGVPEKKVLQPTVPESPAFLLKKKTRVDHKVEEVKAPSPFKAPPVPHFGLPFQPLLAEKHPTEVCPFSFEQREQEKKRLKEEKTEKQHSEVPKFKAQVLPDFDTVVLPERKKLEPTKPEPFRLLADERGAVKNNRLEQMLKEEQKKLKEAALFKANPSMVAHKTPFQPKKEERSAVVVDSFELATERRARERPDFDQLACEKDALRVQLEERRHQAEKEEVARLRKEQVHRAQPVRHYKSVEVKKSEATLTVPKSPNFCDRFRL